LRATLAEFVVANDTILAIDDEGRLFFQARAPAASATAR